MKDKIFLLQDKRRKKMKVYNDTPGDSWKKQLHRIEIQIMDSRIKLEQLKRQYR